MLSQVVEEKLVVAGEVALHAAGKTTTGIVAVLISQ